MIAFDTNVVVRLIVQDDKAQAELARRVLEEACEAGERCFLSDPVLCELEWVLDSVYGASRQDILAAVQDLVSRDIFLFEDHDALCRALDAYDRGKGDLSDYLIGAKGQARGARAIFTFDRALRDQAGFVVLKGLIRMPF